MNSFNVIDVFDNFLRNFFEPKQPNIGNLPTPAATISAMSVLRGSEFVRLGGLSGAVGVALGAYGAHGMPSCPSCIR